MVEREKLQAQLIVPVISKGKVVGTLCVAIENARDAIWVHDLEGNILAANNACEKLTGYRREELSSIRAFTMLRERPRYRQGVT